ncbi:MAG: signal peptidase I [Candidatus Moranbacteria bacterium]|nr:signal peptidase I [Candidatus Moranbacteria bacterium]
MAKFNRHEPHREKSSDDLYFSVGGFVFEVVKIFLLAFIVIVPIRMFLFQPFFVQGASMEPNFEDNQYLIISEFGYKTVPIGIGSVNFSTVKSFRNINRETVIVFHYPLDRKKFFIKRIIGLPGEKVEVRNGAVKIYNSDNPEGQVLDESGYLSSNLKTMGDLVISLKDDEYFVMGDNRRFSSDSRSWGPIKKSDIVGVTLLRAWPLNQLAIF